MTTHADQKLSVLDSQSVMIGCWVHSYMLKVPTQDKSCTFMWFVSEQYGFRKRAKTDHRVMDSVDLSLPAVEYNSQAVWMDLPGEATYGCWPRASGPPGSPGQRPPPMATRLASSGRTSVGAGFEQRFPVSNYNPSARCQQAIPAMWTAEGVGGRRNSHSSIRAPALKQQHRPLNHRGGWQASKAPAMSARRQRGAKDSPADPTHWGGRGDGKGWRPLSRGIPIGGERREPTGPHP